MWLFIIIPLYSDKSCMPTWYRNDQQICNKLGCTKGQISIKHSLLFHSKNINTLYLPSKHMVQRKIEKMTALIGSVTNDSDLHGVSEMRYYPDYQTVEDTRRHRYHTPAHDDC